MSWIRKKNSILIMLLDTLIFAVALMTAFLLRFDFKVRDIPGEFHVSALIFFVVQTVTSALIFWFSGLYHFVWRYIGSHEVIKIAGASVMSWVLNFCFSLIFGYPLPRSIVLMDLILCTVFNICMRYSYRLFWTLYSVITDYFSKNRLHIMIVGAGAAGQMLVHEYLSSKKIDAKVCCFLDDNPAIWGKTLEGVPIVGSSAEIPAIAERYQINLIVIALPSVSGIRRKEIVEICQRTSCEIKIVPGIYQLLNGEVSVSNLRPVDIEDLLGRDPINVDLTSITEYVRDRVVLVTGGGGSIGSELCRQIATKSPRQLIILDIYENNAYDIQIELRTRYPELKLTVLIASVRDAVRMEQIFNEYCPDLVYHAAAHKHVPLMEDSPNEAIKNNVFGTYNTARLAVQYGVQRFVLISTDKAVNPTNIMGASKRLCEMVVQSLAGTGETRFATVRFGNVLGSNGSVIPLFRRQIEAGGPVTVTHPDIIRYFMTIPEAVSLVLQAGAYATPEGDIFVLDMGTPVKIDDLARNLIRLSGMTPDRDIEIVYTGLRPGEKLYEELLMQEEGLKRTSNELIFIGAPIEMDNTRFKMDLEALGTAAEENSSQIFEIVENMVPTFHHKTAEAKM